MDSVFTTSGASSTRDTQTEGDPWRTERFREFYTKNYDDLWKYCLRRASTLDHAEDVLSDVFAVAWRRLDHVPKGEDARPWLFGVARNHLRNGRRKAQRSAVLHQRLVSELATSGSSSRDTADFALSEAATILQTMGTLKERDQEILRLAAWESMPHADIAIVLGCSENAVTVRLHRARDRLQKKLKQVKPPIHSGHVVREEPNRKVQR